MTGTRVDGFDALWQTPGGYFKAPDGTWHCQTPNGHLGNLTNHTVTEHEDGTITVAPSILVSKGDGKGGHVEAWHGFLERGVWRSC